MKKPAAWIAVLNQLSDQSINVSDLYARLSPMDPRHVLVTLKRLDKDGLCAYTPAPVKPMGGYKRSASTARITQEGRDWLAMPDGIAEPAKRSHGNYTPIGAADPAFCPLKQMVLTSPWKSEGVASN